MARESARTIPKVLSELKYNEKEGGLIQINKYLSITYKYFRRKIISLFRPA